MLVATAAVLTNQYTPKSGFLLKMDNIPTSMQLDCIPIIMHYLFKNIKWHYPNKN